MNLFLLIGIIFAMILSLEPLDLIQEGYTIFLDHDLRNALISGLFALLGAFIAAFTAMKIAQKQIDAQNKKDNFNKNRIRQNLLTALYYELDHNSLVLQTLLEASEDHEQYINKIELEVWDSSKINFTEYIPELTYKVIIELYRSLNDLKVDKKEVSRDEITILYATSVKIIDWLKKETEINNIS